MKIELLLTGRTTTPYIQEGIDVYMARLRRYSPQVELRILPDVRTSRSLTPQRQMQLEAEAMLAALDGADWVVLLDEHGRQFTSREFSAYLERKANTVARRMVFVVGGPYGFDDSVRRRADEKISLSAMTFSHEMVRLFFIEQIYRAMTISRGEPYHHE